MQARTRSICICSDVLDRWLMDHRLENVGIPALNALKCNSALGLQESPTPKLKIFTLADGTRPVAVATVCDLLSPKRA